MEFVKIAPLQRITLTKVTLTLWDENKAKKLMAEFDPLLTMKKRKEKMIKWRKLENEVMAKVAKLPIPELLKKKLSHVISPIGFELYLVHCNAYLLTNGVANIFWTPIGTIDVKKMIVQLIQDESISSIHRFEIAGNFCMEDYVHTLWEQMPLEPYKNLASIRSDEHIPPLISYWLHLFTGEIAIFDDIRKAKYGDDMTLHEFLFWFSAEQGNELACKLFFPKLTSEEKEQTLVKSAIRVAKLISSKVKSEGNYINVLFFLFSVMDEEQQKEVFKSELRCVLNSLFEWPWHDLFLKMSLDLWSILAPDDYFYLLTKIREKITSDDRDYDHQMLFKVVWQKIPNAYKKEIINWCIGRSAFIKLFEIKDKDNIELFLRDAVISIDGIAFNCKGRRLYESLIHFNLWDSFRFFIKECSLSKDNLVKFREQLKKNLQTKIGKGQKFVLDKPVNMINQLIQECDKRKNDDEKGPPMKKRGGAKSVRGKCGGAKSRGKRQA